MGAVADLARSTFVAAVVFLLVFAVGFAKPAEALVPGAALAPLAPVAIPSVIGGAGAAGAGVISGTAVGGAAAVAAPGAVWTAGAVGAGVGLAPLAVGIGAAAVVGGGLYIGYRHFSGEPVEWFWQDGHADPYEPSGSSWATPGCPGFAGSACILPGDNIWFTLNNFVLDFDAEMIHLNYDQLESQSGSHNWRLYDASGTSIAALPVTGRGSVTTYDYSWTFSPYVSPANAANAAWLLKLQGTGYTGMWFSLTEPGAPEPGFTDGATITTNLECTNLTTSAVTSVVESSAVYYDPASPPAAPAAACPEGTRITDFALFREAPGVAPFPITQPYQPPAIRPAPSWVPSIEEEWWDLCQQGGCNVELWENGGTEGQRTRKLAPPGDLGWQTRSDRELMLDCYWYNPITGTYLAFPGLEFCADLQWEHLPEYPGQVGQPVTPPTTGTGTGLEPPTSATSGQRCDTGGSEAGFLGSGIIMRGVVCALQWAFSPTQTQTQVALLKSDAATRPPFMAVPIGGMLVDAAAEGFDTNCGLLHSFYPYNGSGDLQETASFDQRGSLPCAPAQAGSPTWQAAYALASAAIVVGTAIGMFLLTSRALKGPG